LISDCRFLEEAFSIFRWEPFDPSRNWPDLGPRFIKSERKGREEAAAASAAAVADPKVLPKPIPDPHLHVEENVIDDIRDLSWATVLKRTFEAYIRGERPNMYGEHINWS
jgi:DDB1- and CUL4-associated factor 13